MRRFRSLALAAVTLSFGGCAAMGSSSGGFDFNRYEFASTDAYGEVSSAAAAQAQAFLLDRHPPGSPLAFALGDLRRAGAACRPDARGAVCTYVRPAHGLSGLVGSSAWRIRLDADAGGRLLAITVHRRLDAT